MKNVSCNCIHRNLSNRMQFKEHGEIAEVLAVSVSTVKNWLRTEVLPSHEIAGIRFVSRETIDRLVSGGFDDNQSAA